MWKTYESIFADFAVLISADGFSAPIWVERTDLILMKPFLNSMDEFCNAYLFTFWIHKLFTQTVFF